MRAVTSTQLKLLSYMSHPWKIFLGTAVVVAAVAAVTLGMTVRTGERAAEAAAHRELRASRAHVRAVLEARERALEAGAHAVVRNPNVRAAIGNADTERTTLFHQARDAARRIGATTVQITNARGVRLVRSDDSAAARDTLTRSALIARAIAGRRAVGAAVMSDSVLHQSIAVQFENALGRLGGAFIATKVVDDSLATAIAQAMSNDVVFFALDTAGRPHITGSSMPRSEPLARFLDERAPIWAAADAGSPSRMGSLTTTDSTDEIAFTHVMLGDTRWVASGAALRSAGGTARGGFVVLRSLDDEMVAFMDLVQWIAAIAGGGLLLALTLSQLVGRRMSRRLQTLGSVAQRVADGDDTVDVPIRGSDEVGRLAESVRTVLVDVRDQRALVEFLTAGAARTTSSTPLSDVVTPPLNGDGLHPGDKLAGRYEILELVGIGSAGKVYRARDVEIAEPVAVKTLRPELASDSPSLAKLNAELRIARRISHRNVLRTHELGEADGRHFVAMEWVDGQSLNDLLSARGRLPVEATLAIARQLCRALQVAHAQGIIHRDLKPHNLIITRDGVLKVTDFGTARLMARPGQSPTGLGTAYIAPEQRHGEDVDGRADLYAAGAVIYQCLTGRTPFTAEGAADAPPGADQLPVPPHEIAADVPRWLSSVVLSALHPNRMRRPKNAGEMLRRLAGE